MMRLLPGTSNPQQQVCDALYGNICPEMLVYQRPNAENDVCEQELVITMSIPGDSHETYYACKGDSRGWQQ